MAPATDPPRKTHLSTATGGTSSGATMKALVMKSAGTVAVEDVEDSLLRDDYVKIKVAAVALNPTDWKHVDRMPSPGSIVGCDVAGTVTEVGAGVKTSVKVGDRLAGMCHGSNFSNHADGGFAETAQLKDGIWAHIPRNMEFVQAATLGVSITTVGQGLYQSLGLPLPGGPKAASEQKEPVLIYGGATATGSIAIQFAKLSGWQVLTVASKSQHEWLQSLGAEKCFDYHDADCGAQIREYTKDNLRHVFDCISEEGSMKISAEALTSTPTEEAPALFSALLPPKGFPREDVQVKHTLAYSAKGEAYEKMGRKAEAKPEDYQFAVRFWKVAEGVLAEGKLKTHPEDVRSGGLAAVEQGLDDLRQGKVKGTKIVYAL